MTTAIILPDVGFLALFLRIYANREKPNTKNMNDDTSTTLAIASAKMFSAGKIKLMPISTKNDMPKFLSACHCDRLIKSEDSDLDFFNTDLNAIKSKIP